jgi:hypothetical protein
MSTAFRTRTLLFLSVVTLAAALAPAAGASSLRTGFLDTVTFADPAKQERAFREARAAGATTVRLPVDWYAIAPETLPGGVNPGLPLPLPLPGLPGVTEFNDLDPGSPLYRWGWFDRQVQLAIAHGLEPIIVILHAPTWAETPAGGPRGTNRPDAAAYGRFVRAAALRFSGRYTPPGQSAPLPRVRYWQAWNEPNRDYFLMPQYDGAGRIVGADQYRALLQEFAASVHAVDPGNLVVAGGLSPIGRVGKPAPLSFMRELLCLSRSLRPTCNLRSNPLQFEAWAHHPYTNGGPTHSAGGDNVSLGDLPKMRRVLNAAVRAGHIRSRGRLQFWATELSWDSRPPDPRAIPSALHARWVSEALYRVWSNGINLVTWWRIEDDPVPATPYQSGFFGPDGSRKFSLTAYRFPVVAFPRARGVYVWGRTPTSRGGSVVVEIRAGGSWRRLGTVRAGSGGIFQRTFSAARRTGVVRARYGGEVSIPFSLARVRDRSVNPFGCGGQIAC